MRVYEVGTQTLFQMWYFMWKW